MSSYSFSRAAKSWLEPNSLNILDCLVDDPDLNNVKNVWPFRFQKYAKMEPDFRGNKNLFLSPIRLKIKNTKTL